MTQEGISDFAALLLAISNDLTSDDVKTMKVLLRIDGFLQARILEEAADGLTVFMFLKESGNLSPCKLLLLKSIFMKMKKMELLNRIEEFEQSNCQMTMPKSSEDLLQETEHQNSMTSTKELLFINPSNSTHCQPLSGVLEPGPQTLVDFDSNIALLENRFNGNQGFTLHPEHGHQQQESSVNVQTERQRFLPSSSILESNTELLFTLSELMETDCSLPEPKKRRNFLEKKSLSVVKSVERVDITDLDLLENDNTQHQVLLPKFDDYLNPKLCTDDVSKSNTIKLRQYQLELAKPSLDGLNSIICAPTGSGKTLTAGFIFQERWKLASEDGKRFRGLFVVCQRTLVSQQSKALEGFFPLDSGISVGVVEDNQLLQDVLLPFSLIVLTAQKLVNCLEIISVKITDFEILIMDECHHTDLNHPYNKIMRFYHSLRRDNPNEVLPMIVGLTASLGAGSGDRETAARQHYVNICANLNCSVVTYVRDSENQAELLCFNPKPSADQIKSVPPRAEDSPFYQVMAQFMGNIEEEAKLIFSKPKERGTQTYENWIEGHRSEAVQRANLPHMIVACEALNKLNLTWMLHDQMRIKDALEFLDSCFPPEWLPLFPISMQRLIFKWYMYASEKLKDLVQNETVEKCPQLHELCQLLRHLHSSHTDPRGILLTRTRLGVDRLIKFLEQQTEFHGIIFPAKFVGQRGSESTMTQTEQENTLRRFRLGSHDPTHVNLLVATDVAQEGLDMPKCNYVIRYNFVSNEIGSVQSRGRARAPNSELYLIVTSGSVNETRELDNLMKEHQMQEALKAMDAVDRRQLAKDIADCQDKNWLDYQNQLARMQARSSAVDRSLVTIHCAKCKSLLCQASELRIRGNNYICIADDFEDRILFKEISNGREFSSDIQLGNIFCKALGCPSNFKHKLGQKVKYKQGDRVYGYVLGKDGCVWHQEGKEEFMTIKQWSKVPFEILTETP